MKWSVALFGHNKWRYELRENKLTTVKLSMGINYQGIEQFREEQVHLTVSRHVDEPTDYDTEKYFVYACTGCEKREIPGDVIAFKPYEHRNKWTPTERKQFLIVTIDGLTRAQMEALCEPYYDLVDVGYKETEDGKTEVLLGILKERRFNIPVDDLKVLDVASSKMLDKEQLYVPSIRDISKLDYYDKKNNRYVIEADGLNLIQPIFIEDKK